MTLLDQLKDLRSKATQGKWTFVFMDGVQILDDPHYDNIFNDEKFVVILVNSLPEIIDRLERAEILVDGVRGMNGHDPRRDFRDTSHETWIAQKDQLIKDYDSNETVTT